MLEPTSPLTSSSDINHAIKTLEKNSNKADALVSVAENISGHPKFSVRLDTNQFIKSLNKSFFDGPRQKIDKIFFYSGNFYLSKVNTFIEKNFLSPKNHGFS